ncbi:MAG: Zn-dependent hydrolase [Solirubrobacterales bacterium]|nr:Zn-dependent hydrolase [Solirubrobacterales bacterium]
MSPMDAPRIDAAQVIADLRELARLTGDERGAQRLCFGETWREARAFLRSRLADIGIEGSDVEVDAAGNLIARLPGADRGAPALAVGSHIDSVPDGGWLDGALGVMAALGVLRAWSQAGSPPPRDIVLIDFADEEGARFGRSLFGSSAMAGHLDPAEVAGARDAAGTTIEEALAENDLSLEGAARAHEDGLLDTLGAYLELHIEQGPALEAEGISCSAVSGCAGVERHRLTFRGQASHAGTTPMDLRRDAGLAAAETALAVERVARAHHGVGTTGTLDLEPGVITALAGRAELGVDLRHAEAEPLADMISGALTAAATIADERRCVFGGEPVWRIAPTRFDDQLVARAAAVVATAGGRAEPMVSGALHDAAEVASRVPVAMIFVASRDGISHAAEEDSSEADLTAGVEAFGALAAEVLGRAPG